MLDELRRSITATFATHVFVRVNGPGRVFSTPSGIDCTVAEADSPQECGAAFPTRRDVALTAVGTAPAWVTDPDPTRAGCDFAAGTVCHVIAERSRWTVVSFAGVEPDRQYPPRASARFSVHKAGDGSGTVRGSGIDCGSRCSVETNYGDRFVLVADASPDSRFVRWRRGGATARCPLTVGPTTRVTAVFERPASPTRASAAKLRATLFRLRVGLRRGHSRIVMPLRANLAAAVSARLTRRGRAVASRCGRVTGG